MVTVKKFEVDFDNGRGFKKTYTIIFHNEETKDPEEKQHRRWPCHVDKSN